MKPIHPIAECYPKLPVAEYEALKADIQKNGLLVTIVTYEDKVLDGVHRQKACEEIGIIPRYEDFPPHVDPYALAVSLNERRRQLTTGQRAVVAERMATLKHGGDRKSSHGIRGLKTNNVAVAVKEVAALNKVGATSVDEARYTKLNGIPEVYKALDEGKLKPYRAKEISRLPREQQANALNKALSGDHKIGRRERQNQKTANKDRQPRPESIQFPTAEETGFPINGTMAEKDAHHRKYGRTPLHPKAVKDMLNHSASVSGYVSAILVFTNQTQPNASTFMASIEAMSQWVPQPEKGTDYGINFASKAKKHLALLRERLPVLVQRTNELQAALCEPK